VTGEIQLLSEYNIHDRIMEYAKDEKSVQNKRNIIKDLAIQPPSRYGWHLEAKSKGGTSHKCDGLVTLEVRLGRMWTQGPDPIS